MAERIVSPGVFTRERDLSFLPQAIGAIGAGYLFKDLFISHNISYEFWGSSIKFLKPLSQDHPPTWFMFLTPVLVVISIPFSFYLFVKNKNLVEQIVEGNLSLIHI